MPSEPAILQFDPVTPQHRAFMARLREIVLEHVEYVTAPMERRMVEKLYAAVLQYDELRDEAIRNLFDKVMETMSLTSPAPFVIQAKDIDPELLARMAKDL